MTFYRIRSLGQHVPSPVWVRFVGHFVPIPIPFFILVFAWDYTLLHQSKSFIKLFRFHLCDQLLLTSFTTLCNLSSRHCTPLPVILAFLLAYGNSLNFHVHITVLVHCMNGSSLLFVASPVKFLKNAGICVQVAVDGIVMWRLCILGSVISQWLYLHLDGFLKQCRSRISLSTLFGTFFNCFSFFFFCRKREWIGRRFCLMLTRFITKCSYI